MSAYFKYFPETPNDLKQDGTTKNVTNILKRFKVKDSLKNRIDVYYDYQIRPGDRPDTIAAKYYGSSAHAWIVLYYNNIIDPIFGWPLFGQEFDDYIKDKYGSVAAARSEIHEYRRITTKRQTKPDGTLIPERYVVIDEDSYISDSNHMRISKYFWETILNDEKKNIKILDKKYLNQIIGEVEDILRNGV